MSAGSVVGCSRWAAGWTDKPWIDRLTSYSRTRSKQRGRSCDPRAPGRPRSSTRCGRIWPSLASWSAGRQGVKELLMIIASEEDERLPVDAHASLVVLAADIARRTDASSSTMQITG